MRVQANPDDIGRCGCGRRDYCDGSHGLSAAQWQAVQAREREAATASQEQARDPAPASAVQHRPA